MSSDLTRQMAIEEVARKVANYAVEQIRPQLEQVFKNATKTCLNCVYFDEPTVMCKLYQRVPPPRIVAFGCVDFVDGFDVPY